MYIFGFQWSGVYGIAWDANTERTSFIEDIEDN